MIWRALKRTFISDLIAWVVLAAVAGVLGISVNAPAPLSVVLAMAWVSLFVFVYWVLFTRSQGRR